MLTEEDQAKLGTGDKTVTLDNMLPLLAHLSSEPSVKQLRRNHKALRDWQFIEVSANLRALRKTCGQLGVAQQLDAAHGRKRREPVDLAEDVEVKLLEEAAELLGYGTKAWKAALSACGAWVKHHRDEDDNQALTSILALSDKILCIPSQRIPMSDLKHTMHEELLALRYRHPNEARAPCASEGKQSNTQAYLGLDLAVYAFTQHVLRELRAHTSSWTETLRRNAPAELEGRAGSEHCRPNVTEVISGQVAWPFHIAGDSGAKLFGNRAWLSW